MKRDDAIDLTRNANNRKIWENVRDFFPHPYTKSDADSFIDRVLKVDPPQNFAITLDDKLIGIIGIHPFNDVYRFTAEMGYWLGEPYWGRGIVTEVIPTILAYGFNALKLSRIEASVFAFNTASIKVLLKNGFSHEATLKKRTFKDGRFTDDQVFVIFRD